MYSAEEVSDMQDSIICQVEDGRSLYQVLDSDLLGELPSYTTVGNWLNPKHDKHDPMFSERYYWAKMVRAEKMLEEALKIADTPQNGKIKKTTLKGKEVTTADMIAHRRLQVETRFKFLGKWLPEHYGDASKVTIEGGDKPLQTVDYSKLSPEVLEELAKQADANKPKS